jgi:hypothetical protein
MAKLVLPPVQLQELTTTDELVKFKQHPKLIPLLVTQVRELSFQDLTNLADSEIYCSQSVNIHGELLERLEHVKDGKEVEL